MNLSTLIPWYGSDRQVVRRYTQRLAGLPWIGIGYGGGFSAVANLPDAETIVANDLHADAINLADVVADDEACPLLIEQLSTMPYHRYAFENAQAFINDDEIGEVFLDEPSSFSRVDRAACYFLVAWGGRNGEAGTTSETRSSFSVRYKSGGGDSAVRFRNAIADLRAWHRLFDRVTFDCLDTLEWLDNVADDNASGLYLDPPWPKGGARYRHRYDEKHFVALEAKLRTFQRTRVVVRSSNCRVTRERFADDYWHVEEVESRSQANKPVAELLITPARCSPAKTQPTRSASR